MNAHEIIAAVEELAPLHLAAQWDNSGLQVASVRDKVNHVAVMLDPSLESITKAINLGADFLISHHPLTMQPRYPDKQDGYLNILIKLLHHSTWLYSAHTSLDANPLGPSRWLASALGLTRVQTLDPITPGRKNEQEAGFGFIGDLKQPLPYDRFRFLLSETLGLDRWQSCGEQPSSVQRIACCPGSGGNLADQAAHYGADVFITGDVRYHAALDAPIRILDVGHFCLEQNMMEAFTAMLGRNLSVLVTFIPATDPIRTESVM